VADTAGRLGEHGFFFDFDGTLSALGDDPQACAEPLKGYAALYIGGMGSREKNFYNALARRMGFEKEAEEIQNLYLDSKKQEAEALVPDDYLEATAMVGDEGHVRDRIEAFRAAGVTRLTVNPIGDDPLGLIEKVRAWAE